MGTRAVGRPRPQPALEAPRPPPLSAVLGVVGTARAVQLSPVGARVGAASSASDVPAAEVPPPGPAARRVGRERREDRRV